MTKMKITQVEPQKKNVGRFNIYLDGKFGFGADEDLVVNFRLVVGKEIKKEDLNKLLFEAEVGKLINRLYGLFSIRARSEKEVRDYLKNLSFKRKLKDRDEISDLSIDLAIERLIQKGLINDLEFAKAWVESRRRSKNKGINALKSELYQKGIDREIIEQVLVSEVAGNEENLAKQALEKKLKSFKNLNPQEFKQKAIQYLMRKGFEYQTVKKVIEEK